MGFKPGTSRGAGSTPFVLFLFLALVVAVAASEVVALALRSFQAVKLP